MVLPHEKPYTQDIKRGQLCAFMIGYRAFVSETRVMVKSIEQFMPGMRIAVATELEDVALHERWEGASRVSRGGVGGGYDPESCTLFSEAWRYRGSAEGTTHRGAKCRACGIERSSSSDFEPKHGTNDGDILFSTKRGLLPAVGRKYHQFN